FSFELAAKRLGADVLSLHETASSQTKGETLSETIATFAAMGVRYFVVRHAQNGIMDTLAAELPPGTALVSGGEGTRSHPTQGLLDAFTIRRHRPEIARLTVAIVGDIAHSRVARSAIAALQGLGVGALRLVGPAGFLPAAGELPGAATTDLAAGLDGADVVMALRIQRERMATSALPDLDEYRKRYGLTIERINEHAKPDALLMHPGPVNWGVELAPELANWPRSLIREQVHNGVAIRMAVLAWLKEAIGTHE
ncbi:MAG: aspartate carbamoyltransferase catalytic subunit, partial [Gammaproteobacteria bacterium]